MSTGRCPTVPAQKIDAPLARKKPHISKLWVISEGLAGGSRIKTARQTENLCASLPIQPGLASVGSGARKITGLSGGIITHAGWCNGCTQAGSWGDLPIGLRCGFNPRTGDQCANVARSAGFKSLPQSLKTSPWRIGTGSVVVKWTHAARDGGVVSSNLTHRPLN